MIDFDSAIIAVTSELNRAVKKYPTWPTDPLHALAVLGEEFGELSKAVLQHTYEPGKATRKDVRDEAIQTAAMALRFLFSVDEYVYRECQQMVQGGDS
jgi:NTP pyrophosphatase (non-canonical NTP hydrolase)